MQSTINLSLYLIGFWPWSSLIKAQVQENKNGNGRGSYQVMAGKTKEMLSKAMWENCKESDTQIFIYWKKVINIVTILVDIY